jgi:hypothetical protein
MMALGRPPASQAPVDFAKSRPEGLFSRQQLLTLGLRNPAKKLNGGQKCRV